jgi:hypothetical protein
MNAASRLSLACAGVLLAALAAVPRASAAEEPKAAAAFKYDSKSRRDPFSALVRDGRLIGGAQPQTPVETRKPVLYGILWDPGGNSIAVLNDEEVRVGDVIGEYRVVEIQPNAVVLDSGGEPVVLELMFDTPAGRKLAPRPATGGDGR